MSDTKALEREQCGPFVLFNWYKTQGGEWIRFVSVKNKGKPYETVIDQHGINRYTQEQYLPGRVTGSAHDYSGPKNIARESQAKELAEAQARVVVLEDALKLMMDCWFDYHDANNLTQPATARASIAMDTSEKALTDTADIVQKVREKHYEECATIAENSVVFEYEGSDIYGDDAADAIRAAIGEKP